MNNLSIPTLFENADWQRCFECYLKFLFARSQSQKTVAAYRDILCRFFQGRKPEDTTRADVEAFRARSTAPASINTYTSVIRRFFDYASANGLYQGDNPCNGLSQARVPASKSRHPQAHTLAHRPLDAPVPSSLEERKTLPASVLRASRHKGSEAAPSLDGIKQSLLAGQSNIPPVALLQAIAPTLPKELQEVVRQTLAAQQAQRINRGVHILPPDVALSDIDPTNEEQAVLMYEHPGVLYPYGIQGSTLGGFSADKEKFVIVSKDLVIARRREILAIILNDLLGDRPALEFAEDQASDELVVESKLFVYASNKIQPKPLSEANLKRMVDYFELQEENEWYYQYWQEADERSRQARYWLPPEPQP